MRLLFQVEVPDGAPLPLRDEKFDIQNDNVAYLSATMVPERDDSYDLDFPERQFLKTLAEHELARYREACLKDQGREEGRPNTIGYEQQIKLKALIEKLRR